MWRMGRPRRDTMISTARPSAAPNRFAILFSACPMALIPSRPVLPIHVNQIVVLQVAPTFGEFARAMVKIVEYDHLITGGEALLNLAPARVQQGASAHFA